MSFVRCPFCAQAHPKETAFHRRPDGEWCEDEISNLRAELAAALRVLETEKRRYVLIKNDWQKGVDQLRDALAAEIAAGHAKNATLEQELDKARDSLARLEKVEQMHYHYACEAHAKLRAVVPDADHDHPLADLADDLSSFLAVYFDGYTFKSVRNYDHVVDDLAAANAKIAAMGEALAAVRACWRNPRNSIDFDLRNPGARNWRALSVEAESLIDSALASPAAPATADYRADGDDRMPCEGGKARLCPDCGQPFQALFHDVPCGRQPVGGERGE